MIGTLLAYTGQATTEEPLSAEFFIGLAGFILLMLILFYGSARSRL